MTDCEVCRCNNGMCMREAIMTDEQYDEAQNGNCVYFVEVR